MARKPLKPHTRAKRGFLEGLAEKSKKRGSKRFTRALKSGILITICSGYHKIHYANELETNAPEQQVVSGFVI